MHTHTHYFHLFSRIFTVRYFYGKIKLKKNKMRVNDVKRYFYGEMLSWIVQPNVRGSLSAALCCSLAFSPCVCFIFESGEHLGEMKTKVKWVFDVPNRKIGWQWKWHGTCLPSRPSSNTARNGVIESDSPFNIAKENYIVPFITIDPSRNEPKQMDLAFGFSKPIKWFALLLKFLLNNKAREKWVII